MSTNESFCKEYFSKFVGIKNETIEELLSNDYNSIETLLALDFSLDLERLPNISMGQRSLVRKALIRLREECEQRKNHKDLNSSNSQFKFNSTPVEEKSIGFVDNDYSFNELIETALDNSFSHINGHNSTTNTLNSELSLSPVKRSSRKRFRSLPQDNHNNSEAIDLKALNKSVNVLLPFNEVNDNLLSQSNHKKKKRKTRKFLYTMKRYRKKESNESFGSNDQSNRCLTIDIDLDTEDLNKPEEIYGKQIDSELNSNSLINHMKEEVNSDAEEVDDCINAFDKPEITSLLLQKSKRIQLTPLNESLDFGSFYKRVAVDGLKTHFVSCNACLQPFRKTYLRKHIKTCKAINQSKTLQLNPQQEINSNENNRKPQMTKEELINSVKTPEIVLKRLKFEFNHSSNRYTAEDVIVHNYKPSRPKSLDSDSSQKKYKCNFTDCSFTALYPFSLEQHKVKHRKNITLEGMNTLVQKQILNLTPIPINTETKKSSSMIKLKTRKEIISNRSKSDSKIKLKSDPDLKSNTKPKVLDCETNECEFDCASNDVLKQHILSSQTETQPNSTIKSIESQPNSTLNISSDNQLMKTNESIKYKCQSPQCKYNSIWKLSVKKHMLNNHNLEYKELQPNSTSNGNSLDVIESFSEKVVNKIHEFIYRGEK